MAFDTGRVTLHRGRAIESFVVTELPTAEAAAILKRYLAEHPRTVGAYFDVNKDATLEEFAAEAVQHPVFRLQAS